MRTAGAVRQFRRAENRTATAPTPPRSRVPPLSLKNYTLTPLKGTSYMPDVGLFTAAEPLDPDMRLIIKFAVEVEGLPVYQESYDVETLAKELEKNPSAFGEIWLRRIKCTVHCRKRPGFSACLTRCLMDGQCGDLGHQNTERLDSAGEER